MERIHKERRMAARLLAGLLLAALLAGLFPAAAGAVDVTVPCYVLLSPGSDEMLEDLRDAEIVADLYLVAEAEADEVYDTYHFMTGTAPDRTELTVSTRAEWEALAQDTLKSVADGSITAAPRTFEADADGRVPLPNVDAGLYLLVARNKDVSDASKYILEKDGSVFSVVASDTYEYHFGAQLIALPTKEGRALTDDAGEPIKDDNGYPLYEINTAGDFGPWLYGTAADPIQIHLKPSRTERYGNLKITKTLSNVELTAGESFKPVTFVFRVTVPGENAGDAPLYSNVTAISFNSLSDLSKTVELTKLPVGKTATVTEIYSGADYTAETSDTVTAVIAAVNPNDDSQTAKVEFSNKYNGTGKSGYGILNRFSYNEIVDSAGVVNDEDWVWTSVDPNPAGGN